MHMANHILARATASAWPASTAHLVEDMGGENFCVKVQNIEYVNVVWLRTGHTGEYIGVSEEIYCTVNSSLK